MRPSELRRWAVAELTRAGVPSPAADAAMLLRHVVSGVTDRPLELLEVLPDDAAATYRALVARRAGREPLQLILGQVVFRTSTLSVAPGVFIPRPETELVAGVAIDALRAGGSRRALDLCTGTGAIAAALADEVPCAHILAVELDPAAVVVARENLEPRGVGVVRGDVRTLELDGQWDVVVSNPPYIPPDAVPRDPEVVRWDPAGALYGGGADGLEIPAAVVAQAARLLRPGGVLVMEHADVQGAAVRALVERSGAFAEVSTGVDLAGRERWVRAIARGM